MTYFRYALLAIMLLIAVTVALANRALVTLALWPDSVTAILGFGFSVTLPLFVVVVAALGLGLLLGLIWEWLRERSVRAELARLQRELAALQGPRTRQAQPAQSGAAASGPGDDILALVDGRKPAA